MGIPTIPRKTEKASTTTASSGAAETKKVVTPPAAEPEVKTPAAEPEVKAETAAPAPAAEKATPNLPATQGTRAVAVAGRPKDVVAETYKDAFKVDWNTLHRIQASNGNFLDVESNKAAIGTEIVLEPMSFQANFQISPGTDDDDDIQYVRYSDDGETTTEGENCMDYVAAMKEAGYEQCKMTERLIIAGTLVGGSLDGKLVQINLPPTSKSQFDRFRMQASIDISKGKKTAEDIARWKLKAVVNTKGKMSWTVVQFDYAPAA